MDIVEIEQQADPGSARRSCCPSAQRLPTCSRRATKLKFEQGGMKIARRCLRQGPAQGRAGGRDRRAAGARDRAQVVTSAPSGSSNTAPIRKQSAPQRSGDVGHCQVRARRRCRARCNPATAETPNRMQPRMLIVAIFHSRFRCARHNASTPHLEVPEQSRDQKADRAERPRAHQTRRSTWEVSKLACIARVGVDVEEDRADELDQGRPPVDAARLECDQPDPVPLPAAGRITVRVGRLEVLRAGRPR